MATGMAETPPTRSTSLAVGPRRPTASTRAGRTPVRLGITTAAPTARTRTAATECERGPATAPALFRSGGVGERLRHGPVGIVEALRQHPGVADDRHEVGVRAPARDHVQVHVVLDAGA